MILSCFGKLFTAVLLTRLNVFSEKFSILNENQSGFRRGYSTIDNIFVLYAFFEFSGIIPESNIQLNNFK
jgi:phosphate starvation-inducible membrane PsiE